MRWTPTRVELMHVPVDEGACSAWSSRSCNSLGNGIGWEAAGDPAKLAAIMADSRGKIACLAGRENARVAAILRRPFRPAEGQPGAGPRQVALWKAVQGGRVRVCDLVGVARPEPRALIATATSWSSAGRAALCQLAFLRGSPRRSRRSSGSWPPPASRVDGRGAGQPDPWLAIYVGRPYGGDHPQPRISDYYDYLQKGGVTGKVISATPHTIARYARLLGD